MKITKEMRLEILQKLGCPIDPDESVLKNWRNNQSEELDKALDVYLLNKWMNMTNSYHVISELKKLPVKSQWAVWLLFVKEFELFSSKKVRVGYGRFLPYRSEHDWFLEYAQDYLNGLIKQEDFDSIFKYEDEFKAECARDIWSKENHFPYLDVCDLAAKLIGSKKDIYGPTGPLKTLVQSTTRADHGILLQNYAQAAEICKQLAKKSIPST